MSYRIKKTQQFVFLLAIGIMLFAGCNGSIDTEQYSTYLQQEENGISLQKQLNDVDITVRYIPIEYQALKDKATFLDKYYGHLYFSMHIQAHKTGLDMQQWLENEYPEDHEQKWQEFLFRLQKKFIVKTNGLELPCVLYHASASPIKSNGADVILIIKDNQEKRGADFTHDLVFTYVDDIWTKQTLEFIFLADNLNVIPLPNIN